MERNFTDERKNEVRQVMEASLLKWIQLDIQIDSNSELVSELGLDGATNYANAYRERVIQKLQKDLEVLDEKYKDAKHIDKMYATNHVADAIQSIQSLNAYILRLAETLLPENGGMNIGKAASLNSMWNSYELAFEKIQQNREFAYDVENIVYGLDGTRRNIEWVGIKQQEYVVEAYELLHPEIKEKMDKFLATGEPNILTENDITSIKYLAYTAPEPYRTVYLEYVGTYEIGYISEEKLSSKESNAWFTSIDNKIYMEKTNGYLSNNPRGDYTTFFHESGHAIDYNASTGTEGNYCQVFSTNENKFQKIMEDTNTDNATLQKAIYCDVYNDIEKKISSEVLTLPDEQKENIDVQKIVGSFIYGSENIELTDNEKKVRQKVINKYNNSFSDEKYEAVSDLYGGITNFVLYLKEGYGHREKNDEGEYTYWFRDAGASTMAPSREFLAIYFSQQMSGDLKAVETTKEHFPQACELMEEMFANLKTEIESE